VLQAGLTLVDFNEFPHDISGSYAAFENQAHSIPMSYSLVAAARP
jgi:hypothetical protein